MADSRQTLLDRAVAGDTQAMSELLSTCAPEIRQRLNGHIAARYRAAFDEDDVLQITFLEAFLRVKSFEPNGIRSFIAWLLTIARNNLRDAIRQLERQKNPPPDRRVQPNCSTDTHTLLLDRLQKSGTSPSGHVVRGESKEMLEQAIRQLPPDYATVVRLYDLEGRDVKAVAQAVDRSIGAVYMLRGRAHQCLKEILGARSGFFTRGA